MTHNDQHQIDLCRAIATVAHLGQTDKAGVDYIKHPERVVGILREQGYQNAVILGTAWLHDVVEDTDVTVPILYRLGVADDIVAAVWRLTRKDGESYHAYIDQIAALDDHHPAKIVKRADMQDNADEERLAYLSSAKADFLRSKYAASAAKLA